MPTTVDCLPALNIYSGRIQHQTEIQPVSIYTCQSLALSTSTATYMVDLSSANQSLCFGSLPAFDRCLSFEKAVGVIDRQDANGQHHNTSQQNVNDHNHHLRGAWFHDHLQ